MTIVHPKEVVNIFLINEGYPTTIVVFLGKNFLDFVRPAKVIVRQLAGKQLIIMNNDLVVNDSE